MSAETQASPSRRVPDELRPIDLVFQAQMNSKNAPQYVRDAWADFLDCVARWDEENRKNGKR